MKKYLIAPLIFGLFCCSSTQDAGSGFLNYFPRETDIPGWEYSQKPVQYKERQLRKLGPVFTDYQAVSGYSARCRSISGSAQVLDINVFEFGDPLDCFGFLSYQIDRTNALPGEGPFVYNYSQGGLARKGIYFVRVHVSSQEENSAGSEIEKLLHLIINNIPDNAGKQELPDFLYLLSENNTLDQVLFYRGEYRNIQGLTDIVITPYLFDDLLVDVFYSFHRDPNAGLSKYSKIMRMNVNDLTVTRVRTIPVAFTKQGNDYIYLSYFSHYFFGMVIDRGPEKVGPLINHLFEKIKSLPSNG